MTKEEDLIFTYCKKMSHSNLARIVAEVGIVAGTKIWQMFESRIITIPAKSTIYRMNMPEIIRAELRDLKKGSAEFDKKVEELGKDMERSKRAILEMYDRGIHKR